MTLTPIAASGAQALFQTEGLPWPPVPEELAARLASQGDYVFATRQLPTGPYGLEFYRAEVLARPEPPPYAVVGFDGHGINSWAAHFFLVVPGLALFVQIPWGGAYADPQASREDIARVFTWSSKLQARLTQCVQTGCLGEDERLVAIVSRFVQPGWAWVSARASANSTIEWKSGQDMMAAIDASIEERIASIANERLP